jgi:integrase
MGKFTAKEIHALRAGPTVRRVAVDTGLQLRIAVDGTKTWIVRYTINYQVRDYTLPKLYGIASDELHTSLADARIEAARIRALARQGIDFQIQEQKAQDSDRLLNLETHLEPDAPAQRDARHLTVFDLYSVWIRDGVRRQNDNEALKRAFAADILPHIGQIPIYDLTEHDIRAMLRNLVARGVNRSAEMRKDSLTQMFKWATKRQPWRRLMVEGNPLDLIDIDLIVSPDYERNYQRDRILSDAEIIELHALLQAQIDVYQSAPNKRIVPQPLEPTTRIALWIMLSTLCRVGEMSMARWEHVDFETAKWFIPKASVKGKVGDLDVFLSPFTMDRFRELYAITGHTPWCFPGRDNEMHVGVKSISKQIGDRQSMFKKSLDGAPRRAMQKRRHDNSLVLSGGSTGAWTPHDLRRTGATIMQAHGVSLDVIDRCQNHVLPGSKVRRHYLHYNYASEKRMAWLVLGNKIAVLLDHRGES